MASRPPGKKAARTDWPRVLMSVCRRIEQAAETPTLAQLAAAARVSPSELQRQFTRRLGVSPKAYAQALALHRLTRRLSARGTALDAVFEAGYESSAAAYANAGAALGATPGKLRGAVDIGWWMGLSDLGWMLLAATAHGVCWLAFGDEPGGLLEDLRAAFPKARLHNDEARLYGWFERVREFVLLPREALDLPLDIQGTAFQSRVWRALRQVPLGETVTYGTMAARLGQPSASRAVAAACAGNRIAMLIPCHRVVGAGGRLAGYRWGVRRKAALLQREVQTITSLT
ncbi:MAG: methylated-DNA--[protein]-cysteine S-methyltransferase [Nevskia sp.]|nr:methylated-DNA--[protein]-cysteine S-methyltransferase [Nevskia sp.]